MPGVGRVTDTHPGEDGIVRTTQLKRKRRVLKRSVKYLCSLSIK